MTESANEEVTPFLFRTGNTVPLKQLPFVTDAIFWPAPGNKYARNQIWRSIIKKKPKWSLCYRQRSRRCPPQLKRGSESISFQFDFISIGQQANLSCALFTFGLATGKPDAILFIISIHWHCTIWRPCPHANPTMPSTHQNAIVPTLVWRNN